ncbi:hypothetical protein AYI69_g10061 [Smittium culicis]|uniref:Uncharacterized protein n=1 Tax=Smittium culicis TaxID=133412 RepID=A0A1R1X8F6_9FUNG|nr:hypothetical protein AYI69_g10061 [Smittium culicis]
MTKESIKRELTDSAKVFEATGCSTDRIVLLRIPSLEQENSPHLYTEESLLDERKYIQAEEIVRSEGEGVSENKLNNRKNGG